MNGIGKREYIYREMIFIVIVLVYRGLSINGQLSDCQWMTGLHFMEGGNVLRAVSEWLLFLLPLFLCAGIRMEQAFRYSTLMLLRHRSVWRYWLRMDGQIFLESTGYLVTSALLLQKKEIAGNLISAGLILAGFMVIQKTVCLMRLSSVGVASGSLFWFFVIGFSIFFFSGSGKKNVVWAFWMMESCSEFELADGFSIRTVLALQFLLYAVLAIISGKQTNSERIIWGGKQV